MNQINMTEFLDSVEKKLTKELRKKNHWLWWNQMYINYLMLAGGFTLLNYFYSIPLLIFIIFFCGAIQHRLGILAHEAAHQLISDQRWFNDIYSRLYCFWPLMMTKSGYDKFHHDHHIHVGTAQDPERRHTKDSFLAQWNLPFRPLVVFGLLLLDCVGGGIPHLMMAGKLTTSQKKSEYLWMFLWNILIHGLLIYDGLWWVSAIWFISLSTTFWMCFRIRIWTEHIVSESDSFHTYALDVPWYYFWLTFTIWPYNTWMHFWHHMDPTIPFYNLKEYVKLTDYKEEVFTPVQLWRKLNEKNNTY